MVLVVIDIIYFYFEDINDDLNSFDIIVIGDLGIFGK